jgi:hypothetical protein
MFSVTQRLRIVGRRLFTLTVSRMITAYTGGSSRVFRRAFWAWTVIFSASFMI